MPVTVCVSSSHNNPTISSWVWSSALVIVICHFNSIHVASDPFTFIRSNVVQHNVDPSGWCGVRYLECPVLYIELIPDKRK